MSTKISELPASAGLTLTDIFPVVDDPAGTPVTQKATLTQLQSLFDSRFVLKAGDTMTGALALPDGTSVAPSYSFQSDLGSGLSWDEASGYVVMSASGVSPAKFSFNGQILALDGSIADPSYSFQNSSTSGMSIDPGAGTISISVNGTQSAAFGPGIMSVLNFDVVGEFISIPIQISPLGNLGFFFQGPVAQQPSGANLTNNVTAGGSDNTIANYTDLTVYATDAAAIRNNIYQLARKLKQVNDALRAYGLLT